MSFAALRNNIIKSVSDYIGIPVILSNQVDPEMDCPFILYSVVTHYIPDNTIGHYDVVVRNGDAKEIRREDPTSVFSFTACSQNREEDGMVIYGEDEAISLADKLQGWFMHVGYDVLAASGAVVDSVNNVQSRSFLQVDEEARRWGFDAVIRYVRRDERVIETIEKVNLREVKI